jgi:glycerate kinase
MKVLIAPDKFKGTASATTVAEAIAEALDQSHEITLQPLADGGEGTLEIFGGGNKVSVVTGPLGEPVEADWRLDGKSAVIEMSQASGLDLLKDNSYNDPINASTFGTGELIRTALERGAEEILIGVGGSATTDGGLGALQAMKPLKRYKTIEINVACDVQTSFLDCARIYGPQKGATPNQIKFLENRLERLAQIFLEERNIDVTSLPMAGAAGGLAGGLATVGAHLQSGFEAVSERVALVDLIENADVIITGEGEVNESSFAGKVVGEVLKLAKLMTRQTIIISGNIDSTINIPVPSFSLKDTVGLEKAISETRQSIIKTTQKAFDDWSVGQTNR